MKKILFLLSAFILLTGCYQDDINDLKKDVDDLKSRLTQYEGLLDALSKQLYVERYEAKDGYYILSMSDGTQLTVSNCSIALADGMMTFTFSDGRTVSMDAAAPKILIPTPAGGFVIDKMKWLRILPEVENTTGITYKWLLGQKEIANKKDLLYVFAEAGVYNLQFIATNGMGESTHQITVTVNSKTYVNGITKVYAYVPAPGQFVNTLPEATSGDTSETMRLMAETRLKDGSMISLGGFGGYVVFGFGHTVVNREGNDFTVLGNATINSAEPGVILVSYDANGNGLPDDEWFEIAGSEYHKPSTIKNYEITYYKPASEPDNPNEPDYIRWTDNRGKSGYLSKNQHHTQSFYPLWMGESYTLKGTFMEATVNDQSGDGALWVSPAYEWGYVDNWPNTDTRAQIDMDWAVDKEGNPVRLQGIDFVKIHTGNRAAAGWVGEISTEVSGFNDLNLSKN